VYFTVSPHLLLRLKNEWSYGSAAPIRPYDVDRKNLTFFTFILSNGGKQREITVATVGNSVEMRTSYSRTLVLKMTDMPSFWVCETCRSVVEKLLFFFPALKLFTWVAVGCNESNSGLKKVGAGMQICECNSHMLEARVLELNGDEMNCGCMEPGCASLERWIV
jgi:hypothetical protein